MSGESPSAAGESPGALGEASLAVPRARLCKKGQKERLGRRKRRPRRLGTAAEKPVAPYLPASVSLAPVALMALATAGAGRVSVTMV